MSDLIKGSYIEQLVEQIKSIDTTDLSNDVSNDAETIVVEEQKIFFWIRLYLKEESTNINLGDDIIIRYTPSGEEMTTKFSAYGKKGLERDHLDQVTNYNPEDDKRILCLMVDERTVNYSNDIPFIRTLFKTGNHYEYQLVRRHELLFINSKTNESIEYFEIDF
jgi:hypothetical protein